MGDGMRNGNHATHGSKKPMAAGRGEGGRGEGGCAVGDGVGKLGADRSME